MSHEALEKHLIAQASLARNNFNLTRKARTLADVHRIARLRQLNLTSPAFHWLVSNANQRASRKKVQASSVKFTVPESGRCSSSVQSQSPEHSTLLHNVCVSEVLMLHEFTDAGGVAKAFYT